MGWMPRWVLQALPQSPSRLSKAEAAHDCMSIVGGVPVMMTCAISDFWCVPAFARAEAEEVAISEARR